MKGLEGRKAVLTGASGGIGPHLARALAREGMDLPLVAHPERGLAEVAADVESRGSRSSVLSADLSDPLERRRVVERAFQEFGRVDVLVNNAAVEYSSAYHELSEAQVREVLTRRATPPSS